MIEQSRLDGTTSTISPATGRALTPRQETVWEIVRSTPGGVTAEAVGAVLGGWPDYFVRDGLAVLRSVALRPLVIRRRTGLWEPRDKTHARTLVIRDGMASELPGDTFEDIFGGAA